MRSARLESLFALMAVGMLSASCAGDHSDAGVSDPSSTTVSRSIVAPNSNATTTLRPAGGPVTFAFGGDVHFEGVLSDKLAADPDHVFDGVEPVLSAADIAMVNLETAITERGTPQPKEYTFRAPPSALQALRAGGIDVATMANNHGVDYGTVGLEDSLAAIRASGFPVVGIGANATQAYAPYRVTVNGERIAIIGATQVIDEALIPTWTATATNGGVASAKDVTRLVAAVRAARRVSDTVVVYLHWGIEKTTCPSSEQEELASAVERAGADVIVGSHTHRLLGGGRLDPAFVDYGLGNFAFYATDRPGTQTGILTVTLTGRHVDRYAWTPAVINEGTPRSLAGNEAALALDDWTGRRNCTDLTP
jgi:poly-gamma-glutamate capsule biosynthesis protein CapA/YwtB (metallophosphatase superfamily)